MNWFLCNAAYIIFIAAIVWGLKLAPKGKFHEDSMSYDASKNLLGICALGVMLHHISQNKVLESANSLSYFSFSGVYFVGIFFFFSGYGLIKSISSKQGYLDTFLKKRIPSVVVPFYTMIAVYIILNICLKTEMPVSKWICSVLGISLINSHSWYPIEITILYLGFYKIFKYTKDEQDKYTYMGLFTLCVILFGLFSGHFAWWMGKPGWWKTEGVLWSAPWYKGVCGLWFHGEWWINSTIFFFIGMLFARFETPVTDYFKKKYVLKLVLSAVAATALINSSNLALWNVSYWSEMGLKDLGFNNKFLCLLSHTLAIFSLIIFLIILRLKVCTKNPFTAFYGLLTMDLYLMHNVFLILGDKFILNNESLKQIPITAKINIFVVFVLTGGTVLGFIMNKINKAICKKFI